MRESLRGLLLSALFFGLIVAPMPLAAESPIAPASPGVGVVVSEVNTNYHRARAMARDLKGLCDCLSDERFSITAIGAAMAIVGLGVALAAIIAGGPFGALSIGALLSLGGAALVSIGAVDSWCSNVFDPWYASNFG